MTSYTADTVIDAPRDVVYSIFADRENNGDFLLVNTRLTTPGIDARQGVGAVHLLGFGNWGSSEEITRLVPNERLEYKVVGGIPVKKHTGSIALSDVDGGTRVIYTMDSTPSVPLPEFVTRGLLRVLVEQFVSGVRKTAAKKVAA